MKMDLPVSDRSNEGDGRNWLAEAEGLEPPCACARRISSAVPYQLGLRLPLDREESPPDAHGGSGIRTHVVTRTNALAGRRF